MTRKPAPRQDGQGAAPAAPDPADISFDDLDDWISVAVAAERVRMHIETVRREIREGRLAARIPRGRDPRRAGAGQGYRIHKKELERWYFGAQQ